MRRTPLKRKAPLKSRHRSTGPDRNTVDAVLERDNWCCARCGNQIYGDRGTDWVPHHRRPRRQGGDPRPDTNLPSNLVLLHAEPCHRVTESERTASYAAGFLLWDSQVPSQVPIFHSLYKTIVWLTDDGRVEYSAPPINTETG